MATERESRMLHTSRRWGVHLIDDQEELASNLAENDWTLCSAFRTSKGTIWVNDSTSGGALQEYGVLRPLDGGGWRQVESITVSWCDLEKMRSYIEEADAGKWDGDGYGEVSSERLEEPHATCHLCM